MVEGAVTLCTVKSRIGTKTNNQPTETGVMTILLQLHHTLHYTTLHYSSQSRWRSLWGVVDVGTPDCSYLPLPIYLCISEPERSNLSAGPSRGQIKNAGGGSEQSHTRPASAIVGVIAQLHLYIYPHTPHMAPIPPVNTQLIPTAHVPGQRERRPPWLVTFGTQFMLWQWPERC